MGILDKGEGSAVPLGADYEHREEYRPPFWYRRGEDVNPYWRSGNASAKKGKEHTMNTGKGNGKVVDTKAPDTGKSDNAQVVLYAVRAGIGVGREIAAKTGLSIQMVGALLSRLSQAKTIVKGTDGRWVDRSAPVANTAKSTRGNSQKGPGLPDETVLHQKIRAHLGNNGLSASELAKLLGIKVPTTVLVLKRMADAGLVRKEGQVWMGAGGKAIATGAANTPPKPRRTPAVADLMAKVVHPVDLAKAPVDVTHAQSQPVTRKLTVHDFAKDFARVMENARKLNERVGETLSIIQDIRAVNEALAVEWGELQERLTELEKAS
jgi:DNA-binding MarR family transcriptional regulator